MVACDPMSLAPVLQYDTLHVETLQQFLSSHITGTKHARNQAAANPVTLGRQCVQTLQCSYAVSLLSHPLVVARRLCMTADLPLPVAALLPRRATKRPVGFPVATRLHPVTNNRRHQINHHHPEILDAILHPPLERVGVSQDLLELRVRVVREHGGVGEVEDAFGVEERKEGVAGAGGGEGGPNVVFEFGYVGGDAFADGGHFAGRVGGRVLRDVSWRQRRAEGGRSGAVGAARL